jgi:hypothetical protein
LPVDIGHLVGQPLDVCLSHVPALMGIRKLTLQKGNISSEPIGFPANKGQRGGALHLHLEHLLLALPLS